MYFRKKESLMDKHIYNELRENFGFIISELETSFLAQHKCSKESELYLNFHDILIDRVDSFMKKYRPPKNCDWMFDNVRGFITQFWRTIYYKGCVFDAYTKTNKHYNTYLNIVTEEEKLRYGGVTEDQLLSPYNIEESFFRNDLLETIKENFDKFISLLLPYEKVYFIGMYEGLNTEELIRKIGNNGFDSPTTYIGTKKRKEIEYRLVCYFAQEKHQIHNIDELLKAFNKFPRLNKQSFGETHLFQIPDQESLEKVITGELLQKKKNKFPFSLVQKKEIAKEYDPDCKIQPYGEDVFAKSKIDRNGKKHDHYVVFINHSMSSYCHITKQTQSLLKSAS